jgi:hypothetical protein
MGWYLHSRVARTADVKSAAGVPTGYSHLLLTVSAAHRQALRDFEGAGTTIEVQQFLSCSSGKPATMYHLVCLTHLVVSFSARILHEHTCIHADDTLLPFHDDLQPAAKAS